MDLTFNPGAGISPGKCLEFECRYHGNKWRVCDGCIRKNKFRPKKRGKK